MNDTTEFIDELVALVVILRMATTEYQEACKRYSMGGASISECMALGREVEQAWAKIDTFLEELKRKDK